MGGAGGRTASIPVVVVKNIYKEVREKREQRACDPPKRGITLR